MSKKRVVNLPIPVTNAAELRLWQRAELDQFYLVFDRNVCVFNKEYTMTKEEANRRYSNIMIEVLEAYKEAKNEAKRLEASEVAMAFYMMPYRIH